MKSASKYLSNKLAKIYICKSLAFLRATKYRAFENARGFLMFSHEGLASHGCIEYNGEWIEAAEKPEIPFPILKNDSKSHENTDFLGMKMKLLKD